VPILSGYFADPNVATGIVMSVPAHAPYDYIALLESKKEIKPITIIDVKDFGDNPAKKICDKLKIKNQNEIEKLDNATEIVYKKEFHTGYLNEKCGKYAGIKVSEIKDQVKDELISNKKAMIMKEFSEEVICRCGEKVIIKKIPDQWFIKYSDNDLTSKSKKHVEKMNIYPQEYKQELPSIFDWYDDRACIRKGSWLGTEFPFKKDWIIEPISDSTLYPAYYIISKYLNENKISVDEMNIEFFDYIFLNKGKSKKIIWDKIKSDFEYWYPVDINLGGKEHKTVHFPVFIMNHIAIFSFDKYPMGIFTHWWITQKNKEKISKSKGGVEHISEAAIKYGIDSMRLYYSHVGSTFIDIEWDSESVIKYKNRIENIFKLFNKILKIKNKINNNIDNWLISSFNRKIRTINNSLNNFDLRIASNEIFFEINKDIQWYLKREGGNKKLLLKILKKWSILMTPITPHLSEELWNILKQKKFISNMEFPQYKSNEIYEKEEVGEYLISKLIDDASEIIKVIKIKPKKIYIYLSPNWKNKILKRALKNYIIGEYTIGNFIKELISEPNMRKNSKKVIKYVNKITIDIKKFNDLDKQRYLVDFNSYNYLKNSNKYLEKIFKCDVKIFKVDDLNIYDPEKRSKFAVPLRPAIYIE
jgi:leucyl-tRNA synthetase